MNKSLKTSEAVNESFQKIVNDNKGGSKKKKKRGGANLFQIGILVLIFYVLYNILQNNHQQNSYQQNSYYMVEPCPSCQDALSPSPRPPRSGRRRIDPFSLLLSIQIHEFALFTHYLISREDFFFYVQPKKYMAIVLDEIYGSLAVNQQYLKEDLDNIESVCGNLPVTRGYSDGAKIQFSDILERYNNEVPELYE